MKWSREEYIELLTFCGAERPMFVEIFGLLVGLDREWRAQGAADEEISLKAFDFDSIDIVSCGGNTGIRGGYQPGILEETSEYRIELDELGRRMKLCKGVATIPLPLDYPVKDMDSWLKVKPLYEFHEDRIDLSAVERAVTAQKKGALVFANIPGGFDLPRQLLGEEELCYAYYDQPELIHDILQTVRDTAFKVLDRISEHVVIDILNVHEDMAGKSGPLIGPELVHEFVGPYYRKIWEMLSAKGTRIFEQDSDGNMNPVIDAFLDCGINVMYPMEPAAGMDIVKTREKYGNRLAFKGGIDKHVIRQSKEAIKRELEYKLQPSMLGSGGIVYGLDHRIPNGTSIENYRYYVQTVKEMLGV